MRDGLYHYVTGLPKVRLPDRIPLTYGAHAKRQMIEDRYGLITDAPRVLYMIQARLVEMEIVEGLVNKIVVRINHNKDFDLVLVVKRDGFVKTCWLNSVKDQHKTLDRSKYIQLL